MSFDWRRFLLGIVTIGISEVAKGNIGSGRKTKKAAEVGGKVLEEAARASENTDQRWKFCPSCGAENRRDANFCGSCGKQFL